MQHDTRPPDGEGTEPKNSGGSPDPECDRTVGQTATGTSAPEEINISPVPLFLVPRVVADGIEAATPVPDAAALDPARFD